MKFKSYLIIASCIFAFAVCGIYFVFGPQHNAYFQWQPHHGQDFAKFPPNLKQVKGEGTPGVDLAKAIVTTPALVKLGSEVYISNCTVCHGEKGNGKGPAGAALVPAPRNFLSTEGWTNGPHFAGIFTTLNNGIPGTSMAAFETLPVGERIALIHFIQSLAEYPVPDSTDIITLDEKFALSKGNRENNIIPIQRAINKLDKQFRKSHPNFKKRKVAQVVIVEETTGAELDSSIVSDLTNTDIAAAKEGAPVKEMTAADFKASQASGEKLYKAKCISCHQANGAGLPGVFPPLANSDYLAKKTVKRFTTQVYRGSKDGIGGLVVNGIKYSVPMPAQTQNITEITSLANYVLNSWGNNYGMVSESEVAKFAK